jgi:hypothetical protein
MVRPVATELLVSPGLQEVKKHVLVGDLSHLVEPGDRSVEGLAPRVTDLIRDMVESGMDDVEEDQEGFWVFWESDNPRSGRWAVLAKRPVKHSSEYRGRSGKAPGAYAEMGMRHTNIELEVPKVVENDRGQHDYGLRKQNKKDIVQGQDNVSPT